MIVLNMEMGLCFVFRSCFLTDNNMNSISIIK